MGHAIYMLRWGLRRSRLLTRPCIPNPPPITPMRQASHTHSVRVFPSGRLTTVSGFSMKALRKRGRPACAWCECFVSELISRRAVKRRSQTRATSSQSFFLNPKGQYFKEPPSRYLTTENLMQPNVFHIFVHTMAFRLC